MPDDQQTQKRNPPRFAEVTVSQKHEVTIPGSGEFLTVVPWVTDEERSKYGWLWLFGKHRARLFSDEDVREDKSLSSIADPKMALETKRKPLLAPGDEDDQEALGVSRLLPVKISSSTYRITLPSAFETILDFYTPEPVCAGPPKENRGIIIIAIHPRWFLELWNREAFKAQFDRSDEREC